MSTIRVSIANTNGTGAGSLRAAVDAVTSKALIRSPVSGSISITTDRLVIDGPNTNLDAGGSQIILANTNISGGEYTTCVDAEGVVLKNLHFDNSGGPSTGSTALFCHKTDVASVAQHNTALVQNCYFRGPGEDDNVFITQRYKKIIFDKCIFDGTTSPGYAAAQVGFADDVGPGYEMPWHVIFKHCIFVGTTRIPYIRAGTASLLGCTIQKIHNPGQVFGLGRVNLVNNYLMSPSNVSYNTSVFVGELTATVLGTTLRAKSIYSRGNYQDGIAESAWVATDYAPTFYTDGAGAALPASYFSTVPVAPLPFVESAAASRAITLQQAGPRNKTAAASAAIAKVISRRLEDVL